MAIERVGMLWNPSKPTGVEVARRACEIFENNDLSIVLEPQLAAVLNLHGYSGDDFSDCDLLVVLGGDGTLLSTLSTAIPDDIPMLGINLGRLGFLSEVEPESLEEDLLRVIAGDFRLEKRMMLEIEGEESDDLFALNEVVVTRSAASAAILSLEIEADGVLVDRISGDGLIVASATGSTAYSMSAGGPIISPGLDCFVLTPICAHTMNARPVVVSADARITVRVLGDPTDAQAALDGRRTLALTKESPSLTIIKSGREAKFVRLHERNYFSLLRAKLSQWTH